jgi:hypothetical protein
VLCHLYHFLEKSGSRGRLELCQFFVCFSDHFDFLGTDFWMEVTFVNNQDC